VAVTNASGLKSPPIHTVNVLREAAPLLPTVLDTPTYSTLLYCYIAYGTGVLSRNAPDIRPDNPTFADIRYPYAAGSDKADIRPDTGHGK
jgi:hypothetical protein